MNTALGSLIAEADVKRAWLAREVNRLSQSDDKPTVYTHTHVQRWLDGARPSEVTAKRIVRLLGERLNRVVTLEDAGFGELAPFEPAVGLDFPRDRESALETAVACWRTVHRRDVLRLPSAAPAVLGAATMRWMAVPADAPAPRDGERRVGKTDVDEVWAAAAQAQLMDSRYGGGDWRHSNVLVCLRSAAPLLVGNYSAETGQALHSALAELSRVVGWAAMDAGHHGAADRLLIQALRLARSAGDVGLGSYVLATLALKTFLAGWPSQAADMAEAAYERGKGHAAPRVLAFCKLAEARALAKDGDGAGAAAALVRCENLLSGIHPGTYDPSWIAYMTPERLATDSVEVHRDLGLTAAARRWAERAGAMPVDRFTRAVGIRHAVLGSTHAIDRDLEQAVTAGYRALDILAGVRSPRAHSYLHDLVGRLDPWHGDPRVRELTHRVGSDLPPPA
ncbi:hypothetical protein ACFRMQ_00425 [Kitasatospora sp. NPDC056783]|uniref:hypothetical protein n=1 Tax=Kitasatospora sp. NPDC056783 TaxID=3345943 RepID=UPI00368A7D14